MNRPFITLYCILLCTASQGQSGDTIKLQQTIGKNYVPAIAHSEKISDQPSIVHLKMQQPDIKGSMTRKQMIFGYAPEPILPARMKGEPLTKLYRSCVKLGVGNYTTSYAEAFVNNNRSRDYSVGAHFKHLSSQGQLKDVGNSAYSENSIDLYGKKFLKKHLLNAGVKAGRDVVHFYGYDPQQYEFFDSDNTKQRFLNYAVNAGIMSFYKDSTMINHNAEL
ncbi:MAG: hypothetical protein ACE5DN_00870, partial [Flavobacteriales bacterium]